MFLLSSKNTHQQSTHTNNYLITLFSDPNKSLLSLTMSNSIKLILVITLATLLMISVSASVSSNLTAYDILQQYDFPIGLLPQSVTGYHFDTSTGKFTLYLEKTCSYKVQGYDLKYKPTITGVLSTDKIKNLKGVSVKVLILWLNIVEITRDGDDIEFSVGIASADFPLDGFDESPQCGCGFDCVGEDRYKRAWI